MRGILIEDSRFGSMTVAKENPESMLDSEKARIKVNLFGGKGVGKKTF